MITLVCSGHAFRYELEHIVRLFYPGAKIEVLEQPPAQRPHWLIETNVVRQKSQWLPDVLVSIPNFSGTSETVKGEAGVELSPLEVVNDAMERQLAIHLYRLLQKATGETPPWGILTGVRPVRLYRQWLEAGLSKQQAIERFRHAYLAQEQKIDMTVRTADIQRPILEKNAPDSYSLYISIPFCPTRCIYCSFVSHDIEKSKKLMPDYIRLLRQELRETAEIAKRLNLRLQTVYVGGGTPTSLNAAELALVLGAVEEYFDGSSLQEYTVEAGRADTITAEKLDVFRKFGVSRISINPQTMDDTILKAIGRSHTAKQVTESFAVAREKGFSAINMDLIAGLPGETPETFSSTLEQVLALAPENITLHTLTVKRSSHLRDSKDAFAGNPFPLNELLLTAGQRFDAAGYVPYYLYRQKGTVQNLENTGFSLPGYEGIYNVHSMEEMHTILAVGAGGVSKLCRDTKIERIFNLKYPYEYIRRFDELIERKQAVEAFYARHF